MLKSALIRILTALSFFVLSSICRAEDTRKAIGGDLMLMGEAMKDFLKEKFGNVQRQGAQTDARVHALEDRVQTWSQPKIQVLKQTEVIIRGSEAEKRSWFRRRLL